MDSGDIRSWQLNVDHVTRAEGYAAGPNARLLSGGNHAGQRRSALVLAERERQVRIRGVPYEAAKGRESPSSRHDFLHVVLRPTFVTDANEPVVGKVLTAAAKEHALIRRAVRTGRTLGTGWTGRADRPRRANVTSWPRRSEATRRPRRADTPGGAGRTLNSRRSGRARASPRPTCSSGPRCASYTGGTDRAGGRDASSAGCSGCTGSSSGSGRTAWPRGTGYHR